MAGFIISVSKESNLEKLISNGTYSSIVPHEFTSPRTKIVAYSTLADYFSMKEGDNVYFLKERKIYGVGKIIQKNESCFFENYTNSTMLSYCPDSPETIDGSNNRDARWICFFEPDSHFFKLGVDMDDVLLYKPNCFRMLRAFQDRSFIKIDDEENAALKEYIYLKNRYNSNYFEFKDKEYFKKYDYDFESHEIKLNSLIKNNVNNNELCLEMVLEAILVDYINKNGILGEKWDYVSHQVIASPFKPLAYIDKMDIFAYKYLEYPHETKPIEKYLILELKRGKATIDTIQQAMRYVDWICKEYASGDYSLIKAGVIAADYANLDLLDKKISRTFIVATHPIETETWSDFTCLKYSVLNNESLHIEEYKYINHSKYIQDELRRLNIEFNTKTFIRKGIKMKTIAYNTDFKFAFVYNEQIDTIKILTDLGWFISIVSKDDTNVELQTKINNIICIKNK